MEKNLFETSRNVPWVTDIPLENIIPREDDNVPWKIPYYYSLAKLLRNMNDTKKEEVENFSKECQRAIDFFKHWISESKIDGFRDIRKRFVFKSEEPFTESEKNRSIFLIKMEEYCKIFNKIKSYIMDKNTIIKKEDWHIAIKFGHLYADIDILDNLIFEKGIEYERSITKFVTSGRQWCPFKIISCDDNRHTWKIPGCESERLFFLKKLIKNKKFDFDEQQEIRWAIENGNFLIVKELLKHGEVDPSFFDQDCLHIAVEKGFTEIVEILLKDERVDPTVKQEGICCLSIACRKRYHIIVRQLISHEKMTMKDVTDSFVHCYYTGDTLVLNEFLNSPKLDISKQAIYALEIMCFQNSQKAVKMLLERTNVIPSQFCYKNAIKHPKIIKILIQSKKMKPSSFGNDIISMCCKFGNQKSMKELLKDKDLNPSAGNNSYLMIVIEKKLNLVLKDFLRNQKFDPNLGSNMTLELACNNGNYQALKGILNHKKYKEKYHGEKEKWLNLYKERAERKRTHEMYDCFYNLRCEKKARR